MPGIEDTEQIQYEKLDELQQKNWELARQLRQKIKLVGKELEARGPAIITIYRAAIRIGTRGYQRDCRRSTG